MLKKLLGASLSPFFVSIIIFLCLQLPVFNLGLLFRDEGYLVFSAQRILAGEVPYRDLFITTTPGSFYLQSWAMHLSENFLIIDRLLFIIFVLLTLFILNFVYKASNVNKFLVLIPVAILLAGPATIGYYNTEGFAIALASFYFLNLAFQAKKNSKYIFLSGLLLGVVYFFKQSYFIWIGLAFFIQIIIEKFGADHFFNKYIRTFIAGILAIIVPYYLYLYFTNSLKPFLYFTFDFASVVKSHRKDFVLKSIVSIPVLFIFLKLLPKQIKFRGNILKAGTVLLVALILYFGIKVSYFEPSRIYYAILLVFPLWILARFPNKTESNKLTRRFALFSLFYFIANASSGRALGTANISAALFLPLVIDYATYLNSKHKILSKKLLYVALGVIIGLNVFYLSWSAHDPNGKVGNIYNKKELKSETNLPHAKYIKVTENQKKELEELKKRLDKYPKDVKLLCFPYCPLLNVLVERQSPSFFNLFYHETFLPENQKHVIDELRGSNTLIVLQKNGDIEPEADFEDKRLSVLRTYIIKNYKKVFETKNFVVLK